jgi:chromosome segregation ATPase
VLQKELSKVIDRVSNLESHFNAIKDSNSSDRDQMIDMQADIMGLTAQIDALPNQQCITQLKESVRDLDSRMETYIGDSKREPRISINNIHNLEKRHRELQDEVAQRTSDFQSAVKELQQRSHTGSFDLEAAQMIRREVEDLGVKQSRRLNTHKERISVLTSQMETLQNRIDQYTAQSSTDRERVDQLSLRVRNLKEHGTSVCSETSRISGLEETLSALNNQIRSKASAKQIESLEISMKEFRADSTGGAVQKQLKDITTAVGSLESHLSEFASEERVHKLEAAMHHMTKSLPQDSSTISEQINNQLREMREYVDHTLEMAKVATQKRLDRFQDQMLNGPSPQISHPSPISASDHARDVFDVDLITRAYRQLEGLCVQRRHRSEDPLSMQLSTSPPSSLESLVEPPRESKEILAWAVSTLKQVRGVMRSKILEMDAAGEKDDEKKLCISDVSYELRGVMQLANTKIQQLS